MTGSFTLVLWAALAGNPSDTVLVEFTDPSCQPCRAMAPVVQRLASEKFPVKQVDVTRQPQLARQYGIVAYPTFVLFSGDREVQRFAGVTTYDGLVQMVVRGQAPTDVDSRTQVAAASAPVVRGQSPDQLAAELPEGTAEQRALAATVRLKVEDAEGWGVGTGTIIDTHFDEQSQQFEALVVTCGHLFKSSGGKGKIEVDLFTPGARTPVAGELLDYDEHLDVALVSIWPGVQLTPAPVAGPSDAARPQDAVFTIGCNHGQDPTVERSQVHAVNRYANRPNLTIGGRQAQGRSGGGLFNAAGQLVGVCNADDPQDGEGIFAGLAAVHTQLDKFNLQAVYQPGAAEEATPTEPDRLAAVSPAAFETADSPASLPSRAASPQNSLSATAQVVGDSRQTSPTEIVCILRSRDDPEAQSEVLVIDGASAALIQQILDEAKATGQARLAARQERSANQAGLARRERLPGPIVRGQSSR